MFDDFGNKAKGSSSRFAVSMLASILVYGSVGAGVVLASAAAGRVVQQEDLLQVEFAPAPEPEPEPEPAPAPEPPPRRPEPRQAPAPEAAPAPPKPNLAAPEELPDTTPEESDAPLAESEAPQAIDSTARVGGRAGGTGQGTGR